MKKKELGLVSVTDVKTLREEFDKEMSNIMNILRPNNEVVLGRGKNKIKGEIISPIIRVMS